MALERNESLSEFLTLAAKSLVVDNHRKLFEVDKMSESYHEIFDSQMPPEAAAQLCENSEAEEATEIGDHSLH